MIRCDGDTVVPMTSDNISMCEQIAVINLTALAHILAKGSKKELLEFNELQNNYAIGPSQHHQTTKAAPDSSAMP